MHRMSQITDSMTPASDSDFVSLAERSISQGYFFQGIQFADSGLDRNPSSKRLQELKAQALMESGDLYSAREILESLCGFKEDDGALDRLFEAFRDTFGLVYQSRQADSSNLWPSDDPSEDQPVSSDAETKDRADLREFERSLEQLLRASKGWSSIYDASAESIGLLASLYKKLWLATQEREWAEKSRDIYETEFLKTWSPGWHGVNAASMSWMLGETDRAKTLASILIAKKESLPRNGDDAYWTPATLGEAYLLDGNLKGALKSYKEAKDQIGESDYQKAHSSWRQLNLLEAGGMDVPPAILDLFEPPAIVLFAGHMMDHPKRSEPRFVPNMEHMVRSRIDEELDLTDARIGYCSLACGSDILFAEAILDREAELNVFLPFSKDDFIESSVQHGGLQWVTRFHRILKLAKTVNYVTEERYLKDNSLFEFGADVMRGHAELRAEALNSQTHLLVVWDRKESDLIGGTFVSVKAWNDKDAGHIIDINEIREECIEQRTWAPRTTTSLRAINPTPPPPVEAVNQREIKCLLFADIVGYSKLQEEQTLEYRDLLQSVAEELKQIGKPGLINTWGDAIFAVMDDARSMAQYALALKTAVKNAGVNLPNMDIRIALHAGPVFEAVDPLTKNTNYYGAHVNRTARLEPIAIKGRLYATEQFAALLTMQQAREDSHEFKCKKIGKVTLPKNFGEQEVYEIEPVS